MTDVYDTGPEVILGCVVCRPEHFAEPPAPVGEGHVRVGWGDWANLQACLDGEPWERVIEVYAGQGGYAIIVRPQWCWCGSARPEMAKIVDDHWSVRSVL